MKRIGLGILAAATVALLLWKFLPNDKKAIEKLLHRLASAASVKPGESGLARLRYPDRLAACFTTNAVLHLEEVRAEIPVIASRSDLIQTATAARAYLQVAEFTLAHLRITFPPEPRVASADAVITGQINTEPNPFGQAFRLTLHKVNGRWLIHELTALERQ